MQTPVAELAEWLVTLAADVLQRETLDRSALFAGRQEMADASTRLVLAIMRRRNLSLANDIVARYPTPYLLAEWMYRNADRIYNPLIRFQGSDRKQGESDILVCVHPVSGLGTVFKGLAARLPPNFRTFALHARGLNPGETPPASFDSMVSRYADRIAEISEGNPPHLLGWSFGGHIAEAISIELRRRGHPTGLLLLIDSWISDEASAESPPAIPSYDEYVREKYELFLPGKLSAFDAMDEEARLRGLVSCLVELDAFSLNASQLPFPVIQRIMHVSHRLDAMFRRCRPPRYLGPTLLVRAADNAAWNYDVVAQWQDIASDLSIEDLPYPHLTMLVRDDSIESLARIISRDCAEFSAAKA